MNAKKIPTIVTWTLLVKTQMDPLCAPVYLDLTEMDGTAQVKAFRLYVIVSLNENPRSQLNAREQNAEHLRWPAFSLIKHSDQQLSNDNYRTQCAK